MKILPLLRQKLKVERKKPTRVAKTICLKFWEIDTDDRETVWETVLFRLEKNHWKGLLSTVSDPFLLRGVGRQREKHVRQESDNLSQAAGNGGPD